MTVQDMLVKEAFGSAVSAQVSVLRVSEQFDCFVSDYATSPIAGYVGNIVRVDGDVTVVRSSGRDYEVPTKWVSRIG